MIIELEKILIFFKKDKIMFNLINIKIMLVFVVLIFENLIYLKIKI